MSDATTFRLDTADMGIEAGWQIESVSRFDEFAKNGVTIEVQYSRDDDIESIRRSREGRAEEVYGTDSPGKEERLRIWLGVRPVPIPVALTGAGDTSGIPTTVQRLRAKGMNAAAYVKDGDSIDLLRVVNNDFYATARDYIRAYDGRAKVMWVRDGRASAPGPAQEMWWAEMPLPNGRAVGWFYVNDNPRPA